MDLVLIAGDQRFRILGDMLVQDGFVQLRDVNRLDQAEFVLQIAKLKPVEEARKLGQR